MCYYNLHYGFIPEATLLILSIRLQGLLNQVPQKDKYS
jgi:hypothetical protein